MPHLINKASMIEMSNGDVHERKAPRVGGLVGVFFALSLFLASSRRNIFLSFRKGIFIIIL